MQTKQSVILRKATRYAERHGEVIHVTISNHSRGLLLTLQQGTEYSQFSIYVPSRPTSLFVLGFMHTSCSECCFAARSA
jgi:hypothetical protein